jgi:hypothetical protein
MKTMIRVSLLFLAGMLKTLSERVAVWAVIFEEKPTPRWVKKNGVIYFTSPLLTNGWSGGQWKAWFEEHEYHLSNWAKDLLSSAGFVPFKAGVALWAAVIPGQSFVDNARITSNIRAEATRLGLTTPSIELILLIRMNFSNKEIQAMGLYWLIGMHNPITDSDGNPRLLNADAFDEDPWFRASYGRPVGQWNARGGFVFGASASSLD